MQKIKRHDVMMAGLGGKGVLTVAQLLTRAGMSEYKNVSYFPAYFGSMRGGLCEATVVLSNDEIPSPLLSYVDAVLIIEPSQLKQFEGRVKKGGLLLVENDGLEDKVERDNTRVVEISGVDIANKVGDNLAANFVILGAYIEIAKPLPANLIEKEIEKRYKKNTRMLSINMEAFREGIRLIAA